MVGVDILNAAAMTIVRVLLCRLRLITTSSKDLSKDLSKDSMGRILTVCRHTTINRPLCTVKRCHSTMHRHSSSMGCRCKPNMEPIASHRRRSSSRHRLRQCGGPLQPLTDKPTTTMRRQGKHSGKSQWACKAIVRASSFLSVLF